MIASTDRFEPGSLAEARRGLENARRLIADGRLSVGGLIREANLTRPPEVAARLLAVLLKPERQAR